MAIAEEFSQESLFAGKLHCLQPRQGYRFSVDAVLLAHFLTPEPEARILDLGAGCGVISLILAYRYPTVSLATLEVQPRLVEVIRRNVALNGLTDRVTVVEGDCRRIATLLPRSSFDRVAANPPYHQTGSGRHHPASERSKARHEILGGISEMARAAAFALKTGGRAAFVYPAPRRATLLDALRENGLTPKRLRLVHPWPGAAARLVLVEAVKVSGHRAPHLAAIGPAHVQQYASPSRLPQPAAPCDRLFRGYLTFVGLPRDRLPVKDGGEGLELLAPLFLRQEKDGADTAEMAAMYAG